MKSAVKRNASLDQLRILCMFMIILLHVQGKTGWLRYYEVGNGDWILRWFVEALSIVSVNCYVLISGYFSLDTKFSFHKALKLWLTVWVWNVAMFAVSLMVGNTATLGELLSLLFPVSTRGYWFVTVYIEMYLLLPFFQKCIGTMSKRAHRNLVSVLILTLSVLPTIVPFSIDDGIVGANGLDGCNLVWFFTLYIVAAYIRKYQDTFKQHGSRFYAIIYFLVAGAMPLHQVLFSFIENTFGILGWMGEVPYTYASILNFVASVALFMAFVVKKRDKGKWLDWVAVRIAPVTFGIFLIHENVFLRPYLWQIVRMFFGDTTEGIFYIMQIFGIALLIFVVCGVAEAVRLNGMLKVEDSKFLKRIAQKAEKGFYAEDELQARGERKNEKRNNDCNGVL